MKRKRTLADLVPPGAKFKRDLGLLALWFALFVLLGSFLIFVIRYENARERLYEDVLGRRLLRSGAQIDPLAEILSGTFRLAVVYGILTFVNIAANYMTFYRESKSIYLMRRIPDRWELPRRCAAVPLIGLAAGMILTAVGPLIVLFGIVAHGSTFLPSRGSLVVPVSYHTAPSFTRTGKKQSVNFL